MDKSAGSACCINEMASLWKAIGPANPFLTAGSPKPCQVKWQFFGICMYNWKYISKHSNLL